MYFSVPRDSAVEPPPVDLGPGHYIHPFPLVTLFSLPCQPLSLNPLDSASTFDKLSFCCRALLLSTVYSHGCSQLC